MANFSISKGITKDIEGGFWNDPSAGWTYRGVTKKYYPNWPGFTRLAQLQRELFPGRAIPRYTIFNDAVLEEQVTVFYKNNFWNLMLGDKITNQTIANFIYDFFVHKQNDCIRVVNDTAKSFAPVLFTFPTKLSPAVIKVINEVPGAFYSKLRNARIVYYNTKSGFSAKMRKHFVSRVGKFPAQLTDVQVKLPATFPGLFNWSY